MHSSTSLSLFKTEYAFKAMQKNGYVVLDGELDEKLADIYTYITKHNNLSLPYFSYSLIENSYRENVLLREFLKSHLNTFYEAHFKQYKTLNESFLVKPAQAKDELLLHQDFCYTDEAKFPVYNVWIPFADVTESNGAMFVLPGSHLWFKNYRSSSLPTARISMKNFNENQIRKVEIKRGQVLLFHPAVFHGSFPNLTDQNRVILTATITHVNAPFLYYHQEENSSDTEIYQLDNDAYLRDLKTISMKARPQAPLVNRFGYHHHIITEKDLIEKASKMF
jgi:hypothetical protein